MIVYPTISGTFFFFFHFRDFLRRKSTEVLHLGFRFDFSLLGLSRNNYTVSVLSVL